MAITTTLTVDGREHAKGFAVATRRVKDFERDVDRMGRRAEGAGRRTRSGTTNMSRGFLELSRAVEDAQYGFRGVVNNIPQIALGLGLGAGIAGAASLAAVGMFVLSQKVDLVGIAMGKTRREIRDYTKTAKEAREAQKGMIESARELAVANRESAILDRAGQAGNQSVDALKTVQRELELAEQRGSLTQARLKGEARLALAQGDTAKAADLERQSLQAQLGLLETKASLQMEASHEAGRELEVLKNLRAEQRGRVAELEIAAGRKLFLETEPANAARAAKFFTDESRRANGRLNRGRRSSGEDVSTADLQRLEVEADTAYRLSKEATSQFRELKAAAASELPGLNSALENNSLAKSRKTLDSLESQVEAVAKKEEAAKREAQGIAEVTRLTNQRLKVEADLNRKLAEATEANRAKAEKTRQSAAAEREAAVAARDRAESERRVGSAREDFAGQVAVLRLQANGRNQEAEELSKMIAIRKEGLDLAERLGLTEMQGIELARERLTLEERARKAKDGQSAADGARDGRIRVYGLADSTARQLDRRSDADSAGGRRGSRGLRRRVGLGSSVRLGRERRDNQDSSSRMSKSQEAVPVLERILQVQEEQRNLFKELGLGVV